MPVKAAQYMRMSSDQQALSISMQLTAIRAYAKLHDYEIVRTYTDEARSGLTLDRREGKQQLLQDVMAADRHFDTILVTDVTRWGRYQDIDESAYYEYHCRKHGVTVVYVLERFTGELSPMAGMEKHMRRVMAAGYSRDLAIKCRAGQVETVNRGYATGRLPCLGYRRQSVSRSGEPGRLLGVHERKPVITDRVRWVLGPPEEVDVVRQVFRDYADGKGLIGIVRELLSREIRSHDGKPITVEMIKPLLASSVVVGEVTWGKKSRHTGAKTGIERLAEAARNSSMVEPIIDRETWDRVQERLAEAAYWRHSGYRNEILLERLRVALAKHPTLAQSRFSKVGLPHPSTYARHFGSVTAAYAAVEKGAPQQAPSKDRLSARAMRIGKLVTSDVFERVYAHEPNARMLRHKNLIYLGSAILKVRVARACITRRGVPYWYVGHLERSARADRWLLILCLNPGAKTGREFLLLPPSTHATFNGRLTTRVLSDFDAHRISSEAALLKAILTACGLQHASQQLDLDLGFL